MIESKSLKCLYREIIKDEGLWNYYHNNSRGKLLKFDFENLASREKCLQFIKNYLKRGAKDEIPFVTENIDRLTSTRIRHIVSCFFLGLVLFENSKIKQMILDHIVVPSDNNCRERKKQHFSYLWFLICLFHDLGYAVENGVIKSENIDEYFDGYLKELPKRPSGIPGIYTKKILKKYMKWRRCCHQCYDHGIFGGIELFHDLRKLRNNTINTFHLDETCPINDGLYWGDDLEQDFGLAAWVVACHNIWMATDAEETVHKYRCFDLDKLIVATNERPIESTKYPVFFLFCLADSIEPIKEIETIEALERIKLLINADDVGFDLKDMYDAERNKYSDKIKKASWLASVEEIQEGVLILNFNK